MAKKKTPPTHVQSGMAFEVQFVPKERNEKFTEVKRAEVLYTGELGLNSDWKNFGNYIKNLRGNKQSKY